MPAQVIKSVNGRQREWEDREWFPPGPQLAICLSGGKNRLNDLTDDELLQVAAAARRQTSWAQARELAAIAELGRRRTDAEDSGDPDYRILSARESVTEEVAAALTVTGNTAATLVHLAERLTGPLAQTGEALGAGRVDMAKARVICDVTEHLPEEVAGRVERAALEKASGQTTGQLRRRIKRIAQRLAPEAVEERKQEAVRRRRLELWDTPSGTADLALCDLAAEDAHAIYNKITAAAHGIKADGDTRPLNTIRADLATQLLHGLELPDAVRSLLTQTPDHTVAAPPAPDGGATVSYDPTSRAHPPPGPNAEARSGSGSGTPSPATDPSLHRESSLELDRESATRRNSGSRSAAPHPSPVPAPRHPRPDGTEKTRSTCAPRPARRTDAAPDTEPPSSDVRADPPSAAKPMVRGETLAHEVQIGVDPPGSGTSGDLTGDTGIAVLADAIDRRLTHVRGRVHPHDLPDAIRRAAERIHHEFTDARDAACQGDDETHGRPGYRPPAAMRREVEVRHATCVFPTCNQPSHRCDLDHTTPWRPGITCRCNLAPLCRRHHRAKQSPGWRLFQIWAGLLIWVTPSGAWYIVHPDRQ